MGAWAFIVTDGIVRQHLIWRFVHLAWNTWLSIPFATAFFIGVLTALGFYLHDRAIADLRAVNPAEPLRPEE